MQHDQAGESGPRERLNVDGATHSRSAVLRACYSLAALATFDLHQTGSQIIVEFIPNGDRSPDEISKRLLTALIDFSLREEIEASTSELRTIIWQTAFGETMKVPNE